MSKECTCPICRFMRDELTVSEMAWYLKGSIEGESKFLKLIAEATDLEELKKAARFEESDTDGDRCLLNDLKTDEKRNPNKWWDLAMDTPEDFVIRKEEKNLDV